MNILQSQAFRLMSQSLDVTALRQQVIANNIANVDTPNFKRSYVKFEELLQTAKHRSLSGTRTHIKHIPIGSSDSRTAVQPQIASDRHTAMNNNGNNVDIDAEMALLAKNQLHHQLIVNQISHEIGMIRRGIGGGR